MRLDFEWMKRIGIGGVQNFDACFDFGSAFDTPPLVETPLNYLTPDWQQALRYSVELANKLDLEFTVASSPGWSESGGPWVQPRQAMKKLVWSETVVNGPTPFRGCLTKPPYTTGPFQTIPVATFGANDAHNAEGPVHYADVAVVAYRLPPSETSLTRSEPRVTSSSELIDAAFMRDCDLANSVFLPFGAGREAWVQFSFSEPQRIQAVTAMIGHPVGVPPPLNAGSIGCLEASNDGLTFERFVDIPRNDALPQTVSFPPVTARLFRILLRHPGPTIYEQVGLITPPRAHQVVMLRLHTGARVNRFEDKAGYSTRQITSDDATPPVTERDLIRRSDIVDLTGQMRSDGSLDWTPPPGQWVVMRFGYSLTGRLNHPASRGGTGLEVDKLNREHVQAYIEKHLDNHEEALGSALLGRSGLRYILTDSYEAGAQNWTDDMLSQFERRRGYSAIPWLPVLAGRVVGSAEESDRLLWDFRKTIGELIAEAHYGQIADSLRRRGLGRYGESHEAGRAFIGDGMEVKKTADVPMGAIWAARLLGYTQEGLDADIRESASVAHIYGQNIVAAESFTAFGNAYGFAPEMLKPFADRAMAMGVNRFVIHTSVHQPDNKAGPGIGLGPFGQWFTRKEPWAEQAVGWISYLTRSSYLLQQGRFVADIAYLYGEDTNLTSLFHTSAPPIPRGYNFDFINSDALINEISVKNGRLVTRSGMEYRVLALDPSTSRISVPVLRKIHDLVRLGAIIVGTKPIQTPSLADDENEFFSIVTEIWDDTSHKHTVGGGLVFGLQSLDEALRSLQIHPDIEFLEISNTKLHFVHRTLSDNCDIYFVHIGNAHPLKVTLSFRVSGRKPELWNADTATITPLSYYTENGRTVVSLQFCANDSLFIVFREPTNAQSAVVPEPLIEVLASFDGPWDVIFPIELGAPPHVRFDRLYSWTEHLDEGITYFSGAATYSKTINIQPSWLDDRSRVYIDLGEVKNLAELLINGRSLGVLWKAPFIIDITDAASAGNNQLEIKVANLWPNRLIGDKQPGARKIAFATFHPFQADSPLLPSGLLGPVSLFRRQLG